ncbi:trypsin alpha-like [Mytilus edulis]|uniref:trypsin alpha-like n=1 Tax=Mytilus edulis TaxID=6550 RepID=UPI0039EE55AF
MGALVLLFTLIVAASAVDIWQPAKELIESVERGDKWPVDDAEGRIVGGEDTTISQHPHQVSLQRSNSHICGGAIVNADWIVTAAHCVDSSRPQDYRIRAGSSAHASGGTTRSIELIVSHENYNSGSGTFPNDIALMKMSSSLSLTGSISAITLATGSPDEFAGQTCEITGWGRTCGTCGLPSNLQSLSMQVLRNSECRNYWTGNNIIDGHICIFQGSGYGACNGDSGGPMVCSGQLAGVTSWGASGCPGTRPSVYTRIGVYKSWMDFVMASNS